jgi:D-sedoheptulose 7-phosphate isomerase
MNPTQAAERVGRHLRELSRVAEASLGHAEQVAAIAAGAEEALRAGGTLFFCGNGGSAADAQHLAAEYVVRFARNRSALPAIALTVDTSVLTAAGNDFGFEHVFARQVEALGRPGDLLFLHSTSGQSPNLVAAARAARARGLKTVAFLARDGGALIEQVDDAVVVPTEITAHAQEVHLAVGHAICDLVDEAFSQNPRSGSGS